MPGTIEEETARVADALEALVDIFDGTTVASLVVDANAILAAIRDVLNGVTAGTPFLNAVAAMNTANTHRSNTLTQVTGINSGISGGFGAGNGYLATMSTQLTGMNGDGDAVNSTLTNIKTAIDNIQVNVTLQQSDVASAIENQTAARQPLIEQGAIRRDVRGASVKARTPFKPGSR